MRRVLAHGFIESFNARLRDELLDGEIFYTLCEAQIVIESWRRHYSSVRPMPRSATALLLRSCSPTGCRGDVGGLRADRCDPLLHRLGNELRAIIGTDMAGNAAQDEQIRGHVDDVDRFEPAKNTNGQALMGELVDDVEQAELSPTMGALLDKIVGPDVIGALCSKPDARSVIRP
jgi:hypothetical protein